jgi:hypothetical protein
VCGVSGTHKLRREEFDTDATTEQLLHQLDDGTLIVDRHPGEAS